MRSAFSLKIAFLCVEASMRGSDCVKSFCVPVVRMAYYKVMYRTRRNNKLYEKQRVEKNGCPFCDPSEIDYRLVGQSEHAYIIPNKAPYDVWEHHKVIDNLMVIPKRHVSHTGDLTDEELLDLMRLISKYEADGYNVYARTGSSYRRSQEHQHTHLIKIDNKPPRVSVVVTKPYFLVRF